MSIQKIIQESINKNPLEVKDALAEELRVRIAEALEAKMNEEVELDENVGGLFKNASEWEHSAKARGLVVKSMTHPSGETTKYQIAKDKEGNNRGHFDHGTKSGRLKEEVELDEAVAEKPAYHYYATTQYMHPSEMKLLHDKKKPFATEKEAFAHIKSRGGRQDGSIHKVHTATGKIVSVRHVAGGQAGYVSDVGRGDPKSVHELK